MSRRFVAVVGFLALVVLLAGAFPLPASAYTTIQEVEYEAHDTGSDFSNAETLDSLQVEGDKVVMGPGTTTHIEDFEDDGVSDWTVYYDNPDLFGTGSGLVSGSDTSMLYRPGSQEIDNLIMYDDFGTDGQTGTMVMRGYIDPTDFNDGTNPHQSIRLVDSDTGAFYHLGLISASQDFRFGSSQGGQGAVIDNTYSSGWGDYRSGDPIEVELKYDYSTNQLTATVYGYDTWTRTVTTNDVPSPDSFAVGGASQPGGGDYMNYDDFTMQSGTPQNAEYLSDTYTVEDPTQASVTLDTFSGGEAEIEVIDGNGNVLGSKTVTSAGTHYVDLNAGAQSGTEAQTRISLTDTSAQAGGLSFEMSEEAIYFENWPPEITDDSPNVGETVYTNTPEFKATIDDHQFDEANDDSVIVEWYVDGTKVGETGPYTSAQQVSFEMPSTLAEGEHQWHARALDDYGGEAETTFNTVPHEFTVDHKAPDIDNPSAEPSGGTETPYGSNELSIDVSDYDFAHDGDSLTVGWYVDGTLVHQDSGIGSNGTVSYTTDTLNMGNHDWYVRVGDSWGNEVQSDTFTYEVKHFAPEVENPSIDGLTRYDTNTLSVDVSDRDFAAQGDTVDVGFYVDGSLEYTETISSNQTVSFDAGPYADGNYSWHVEAVDDYGFKTQPDNYTLNIQHGQTAVSDPSLDGLTHYENNTLAVDVGDPDFTRDGDTVDVGFYVDGALVNSQTITSNQTVSYDAGPYADGNYTWNVEAVDDYGHKTTTDPFTLEIQHDPPGAVMGDPSGTIHYERPELTIDVDDADFERDGDSVEIAWYVDGFLLSTENVTSNGTYTYQPPALVDGEHNWSVELYDDYGYVRGTTNQTFTVDHFPTRFDNSTLTPTGTLNQQTPTFSVDITDRDFPLDGDSVDVGLYVNPVNQTGGAELIDVKTVYENTTVEVTPQESIVGDNVYYWRAVDDYGHDTRSANQTVETPNSLYVYSALSPHNQLNETVGVAVISGSGETLARDTFADGSIEFRDLPRDENYVFSITADGYYQRGVYVDDLYERSAIFLLPGDEPAVYNKLQVRDATGRFSENPILNVQTVVNTSQVPAMTDRGPQWVTIGGDRIGAVDFFEIILQEGGRYRFQVRNQDGDTRTMGHYTAKTAGTIPLHIGEIQYPAAREDGFVWNANMTEAENGGAVTWAYNDVNDYTDNVSVTMTVEGTGEVIGEQTLQAGTYGEAVLTVPVDNSTYRNADVRVSWWAYRNGTRITGDRVVSGPFETQAFPLGATWLSITYAGMILIVAFAGGAYVGVPAMFGILGAGAGLAVVVGIAPATLGGGVAVAMIGLGATMQRWNGQVAQTQ